MSDSVPRPRPPLQEAALPTERVHPWHKLYVFPASGQSTFIVLTDRIVLVNTHCDVQGKRLKIRYCPGPAVGNDAGCPRCAMGWMPYVYGYLGAQVMPGGRLHLVALTQASLAYNKDAHRLQYEARGYVLDCWRSIRTSNGPLHFAIRPQRADRSRIPAGWDVREELGRRFGRITTAAGIADCPEWE
jgi:hypothetical protein